MFNVTHKQTEIGSGVFLVNGIEATEIGSGISKVAYAFEYEYKMYVLKVGYSSKEYNIWEAIPFDLKPFFVPTIACGTIKVNDRTRHWTIQPYMEMLAKNCDGQTYAIARDILDTIQGKGIQLQDIHEGNFAIDDSGFPRIFDYEECYV